MSRSTLLLLVPVYAAVMACSARHAVPPPATPVAAAAPKSVAAAGCLPAAAGYLRARMRGAINLDIDWHDADMRCEGGPRPDNRGIRVAFAGPPLADGHRLRFVFGIGGVSERQSARNLPTNVTIIVEGAQQLFSTRGEDRCSVDQLAQSALPPSGTLRRYRITARGFCVGPATSSEGGANLLLNRFDFAGSIAFEND